MLFRSWKRRRWRLTRRKWSSSDCRISSTKLKPVSTRYHVFHETCTVTEWNRNCLAYVRVFYASTIYTWYMYIRYIRTFLILSSSKSRYILLSTIYSISLSDNRTIQGQPLKNSKQIRISSGGHLCGWPDTNTNCSRYYSIYYLKNWIYQQYWVYFIRLYLLYGYFTLYSVRVDTHTVHQPSESEL